MRSVHLLTVILASVLILSFAIILTKENVLIQGVDFKPVSFLNIREVDVKPTEVTSAMIEVNVTAYIDHSGGKTSNASMLIRAINSDTRLLGTQASAPIPETSSEKNIAVSQNLKLERNGGYELRILLFDDGSIRDSGSVNIQGLNALTPISKRSGIVLNNMDFTVSSAAQGKVGIKADVYLENRGQEASENLNLIVKAREAASNLLADKTSTDIGVIASEATAVKSVQLVVPDEYNYMVAAELWKGDILINTWEKPVLLAPTKTIPKESVEKKVEIEVSKFVRETAAGVPGGFPIAGATPAPQQPGFEILASIVALIIVIALRRRLQW